MPRPGARWILGTAFATTTLASGAGGQTVSSEDRALGVPTITGVEATQLLLAQGWPRSLHVYEPRWGSPMKLRVGVANAGQIDEVRALDTSSRPAHGFETSFSALPVPDCGVGSSVCVEVDVRPSGADPGTYRIGVVADGTLLTLAPPVVVVCNPFRAPISLSLQPGRGVGRHAAAPGRVRLGCPALPPDAPAAAIGYDGPTRRGSIGNTVVYLELANSVASPGSPQVAFPDSVIVPVGRTDASFDAWAPEHLAPVDGRVLHVDRITVGIRAELRGGTGAGAKALGETSFDYPRLDTAALSVPSNLVGGESVVGSVALTQRSSRDERVCFSVYDARGAPATSSGHQFSVTAVGAPSPGCVTIPSGQISAPFRLAAEVDARLTEGGDFELRATRSHRDTNGWTSFETEAIRFKARPRPKVVSSETMTIQP